MNGLARIAKGDDWGRPSPQAGLYRAVMADPPGTAGNVALTSSESLLGYREAHVTP